MSCPFCIYSVIISKDELIKIFVYRLFSTKLIVILKTAPFTPEVLENNFNILCSYYILIF